MIFPNPELVLFDLDGTLYDYDPAHQAAIEAVKTLVETQFEFKSMDFDRYFSDARMKVKENLGAGPAARSRLLYFKTMFELMGLGSSVLNTMNCEYVYWNTFVQNSRLFDGVTELIDELRIRKVPKILITNQTTSVQFKSLSILTWKMPLTWLSQVSMLVSKNRLEKSLMQPFCRSKWNPQKFGCLETMCLQTLRVPDSI